MGIHTLRQLYPRHMVRLSDTTSLSDACPQRSDSGSVWTLAPLTAVLTTAVGLLVAAAVHLHPGGFISLVQTRRKPSLT